MWYPLPRVVKKHLCPPQRNIKRTGTGNTRDERGQARVGEALGLSAMRRLCLRAQGRGKELGWQTMIEVIVKYASNFFLPQLMILSHSTHYLADIINALIIPPSDLAIRPPLPPHDPLMINLPRFLKLLHKIINLLPRSHCRRSRR